MRRLGMALLLASALVLTACGEQNQTAGQTASPAEPTETAVAASQTETPPVLVYPPEEEGAAALDWKGTGRASVKEEPLRSGKNEVVATGRKKAGDAIILDITPYIEIGKHYNITTETSFTIEKPTVDYLGCDAILVDGDGKEDARVIGYDKVKSYRKMTADGNLDTTGAEQVLLRWYLDTCVDADIHVTALQVRETGTGPEAALSYESMNELALKHGFSMGAMINPTLHEDAAYRAIVEKHFGTLTASNEMKAYSLLDQNACIRAAKKGNDEPQMDFETADMLVQYASDHGMKVRGHNLVWDAYMVDWFFNEGYETDGKKVSKEVMKKRMESYIKQVLEHFDTGFPGVVTCWDVVNEAVGDTAGQDCRADDPCHVRTKRNGEDNPFYRYVGEDYITLAFQYARKYAAPETKLFYNDYNNEYFEKRNATVELVKTLNRQEKLVDGVGMQCYFNMDDGILQSNLDKEGISLEDSVRAFADLGVEVHLTEMTVRNYDKALEEAHGDFYYRLFKKIRELNEEGGKKPVTNVSIWGLMDAPDAVEGDYVYSQSGTYYGIWDSEYQPKKAFAEIVRALKE